MGEPFDRSPMTNAPVNELGVMVLFGMVAAGLGLQVESVQGKFPDCLAKRQVAPGKWQHLRIEFEYESKNFKLHGHDPKGCDMIVCWRHNWKECPAEIEVVELSRLVGMEIIFTTEARRKASLSSGDPLETTPSGTIKGAFFTYFTKRKQKRCPNGETFWYAKSPS